MNLVEEGPLSIIAALNNVLKHIDHVQA